MSHRSYSKNKNIALPFLPNCQNFLHMKSFQTRSLLPFFFFFIISAENKGHDHLTEAQNHQR